MLGDSTKSDNSSDRYSATDNSGGPVLVLAAILNELGVRSFVDGTQRPLNPESLNPRVPVYLVYAL